mgnify:CR=1 FL=1
MDNCYEIISKSVESAQRKVEGRNFSIRKNVLKYDDAMNAQREIIYGQRREVLDGENLKDNVLSMMDGTVMGMGRGAGNCAMELLLGFLKNPKYNLYPVIKFIEENMVPLKKDGVVWGYDLQYLMTGLFNQHPRTAIAFTKDKRTDLTNFYKEITSQE